MKRFGRRTTTAAALAILFAAMGCNQSGGDIERVQTNLVDKSIFEGEWWYAQTVIDVQSDEALVTGVFNGQMGWADLGVDTGASGSVARIRWVIDENYLFAYRAYELIDGGNDDGRDSEFRGQPLAVFAIEDHVDVRYDYNPITGEKTNVRVEDTSDRRWFERQFIRVDWSENLVTSFYYLGVDVGALGRREATSFYFDEGAHPDFPESYEPQYVRVVDDPTYKFADEWPAEMQNTVHYMSVVTQELHSPGAGCIYWGGACQTAAVTIRNSFLRVPPNHEYAVETETHPEFDRFGTFRTYQRTYIRGGRDGAEREERCAADADCGIGGYCDLGRHICVGGLTDDYGETDFLTFYRPRFNQFMDHLTDTECTADWQCDGRYGDTGVPDGAGVGSQCDRAARRCTIPMAERTLRKVNYYLNPGYPGHLVHTAFEVVGDWNEGFMRGWRAARGLALPTAPNVTCQSDNPIGYCYCGSPDDVGDGTCTYKYDPFQSPEAAMAAGVTDPYQCHIQAPDGFTDPAHPSTYADYAAPAVYGYEFVGDECALVLHANSCDKDPSQPCEDLGDLRYQHFNYIQQGLVYFGGVAIPLVDPTTGEFVSSNANMAAPSAESAVGLVVDFFPVLRGEPGALERYFEGEITRDYFENLGRVERPVSYAPSGTDGYSITDGSRPGMPVPTLEHILSSIDTRLDYFERLAPGPEGRAAILSDRMRRLAGTPTEARLLSAMGPNGADLTIAQTDISRVAPETSAVDESVIDQVSPFRDGFMDGMRREQMEWQTFGRYNVDPPMAPEISNVIYGYWAQKFASFPVEEASIRMQQLFVRGIMHHEVGHAVGLRHNFGGSYDRDNYQNGFYNVALRDGLALPSLTDEAYDPDGDGFTSGEDVERYYQDLRTVRDARHEAGLGLTMTNSVMDYDGDMSGFGGLGRYDIAAANWNAFNVVEAYNGDPRVNSDDSFDDMHDPTSTTRSWWTYYRGGESCRIDTECPYSRSRVSVPQLDGAGGALGCEFDEDCPAGGWCNAGTCNVTSQAVYQRCIQHPREILGSRLPTACSDDSSTPEDESANCICSPFDEDFQDYTFNVPPYDNDVTGPDTDGDGFGDPDRVIDHYPVDYLFCTDDRVIDISWCSRQDAGESFVETIDFFRRRWEEGYPTSYYRRFRRTSLPGASSLPSIIDAAKIYQHFFFRYFYEPGFRSDDGPLGADDQFFAAVDSMNWMTELATMPDTGSYEYDPDAQIYRHLGETEGMAGSDLSLPTGMGFPMWSKYQEGYWGFFRRERAGTFMDKYYALLALAIRDWGFSFSIDERFFINYYDLFPVEMTEFFGGIISGNDRWFGPRIEDPSGTPTLHYLNWYRGQCLVDGQYYPCRGSQEEVFPGRAMGNTTNDILRDWATILALATFPVFYDTSFEQRLSVFKIDSGESFTFPETQPDGSRTCAYGAIRLPGTTHDTGCSSEEADYAVFESDRFHTGYVAVKVRPRITYNLEEEQIGFQLLRRLVDLQQRVRVLRRIDMPTAAEREELATKERDLNANESFLEYLIDIQRQYGINRYF